MRESGTAPQRPSGGSTQAVARRIETTVPGRRDQVPVIRHWIGDECRTRAEAWLVELLTCELVTNAIRHTASGEPDGRVRVHLDLAQDVVVRVHDDGGDTEPTVHPPDGDRDGGRGLELVEELAAEWGYEAVDGGGRVVWCRIDGTAGGP